MPGISGSSFIGGDGLCTRAFSGRQLLRGKDVHSRLPTWPIAGSLVSELNDGPIYSYSMPAECMGVFRTLLQRDSLLLLVRTRWDINVG